MDKYNNQRSFAVELLLGLIPFTKQNFKLFFDPNQFINDFEKTSNYPRKRIWDEFHRAEKQKLFIIKDETLCLTLKGRQTVQPFIAEKLSNDAKLMIVFDIPEEYAGRRQKFRNLLKQLGFHQIQLSVWVSKMDHRAIITETIRQMELEDWVKMYEAQEAY